jgi:hypothetical protein
MEIRTVRIEYLPARAATRLSVPGSDRVVEVADRDFERAEAAVRVVRRLLTWGEHETPAAPDWALAAGRIWADPLRYDATVVAGTAPAPEAVHA